MDGDFNSFAARARSEQVKRRASPVRYQAGSTSLDA
jgi:hypothetical protein